jgi:fructose-bisphosphate aldolase class II
MKSLKEVLADAKKAGNAVAHFNVSDSTQLNGIVEVAQELGLPVVIGVSEGEGSFIGLREVAALVKTKQAQGLPVYINADHFKSLVKVKEAIDAGFDSAIIDGAKLSYEENVLLVKGVVAYAKSVRQEILIEAELGYIGESSKLIDAVPANVAKTDPHTAKTFVEETGIDLLAPSVGNVHGIVSSGDPDLDIALIKSIAAAVSVPLVLHGASGNSDADIQAAIAAGINMVHINTEIRVAYRKGIEAALAADTKEVAPYKYLGSGKEEMKQVVRKKMHLFN